MDRYRSRLAGILILLVWVSAGAAAERTGRRPQVDWHQDVREAWKVALKVNRPMLLFVTMDGCLYCEKMKQTTLQDPLVVYDLRSKFIPVVVNVKDAPDLVKRLMITAFPTTTVIETNGDVMDSIAGFQTAKQLRQRLYATLRLVAQERLSRPAAQRR